MVLHLDRCFLLPGLTIMRRTTIVSPTEAKKNRSTLLTGSNHDVQGKKVKNVSDNLFAKEVTATKSEIDNICQEWPRKLCIQIETCS